MEIFVQLQLEEQAQQRKQKQVGKRNAICVLYIKNSFTQKLVKVQLTVRLFCKCKQK